MGGGSIVSNPRCRGSESRKPNSIPALLARRTALRLNPQTTKQTNRGKTCVYLCSFAFTSADRGAAHRPHKHLKLILIGWPMRHGTAKPSASRTNYRSRFPIHGHGFGWGLSQTMGNVRALTMRPRDRGHLISKTSREEVACSLKTEPVNQKAPSTSS